MVKEWLRGGNKAFFMMGRIILILSILSYIHVFLMMDTMLLKASLVKLEQMLLGFWWIAYGGGRVQLVA